MKKFLQRVLLALNSNIPRVKVFDEVTATSIQNQILLRLKYQELLAKKGLPPLPAIPTLPGHPRWSAMLSQARSLLCAAAAEMQSYQDERSQAWQESPQAEEFLARQECLEEIIAQLEECA